MALLTPLDLEEARALGARYGLAVRAVEPIPHGSVNSNFVLELEPAAGGGDRAFLRVYEESDAAAVAAQNRLLAHLVARGVPTPAPLARADGGTVDGHRGKPAVLFPFRPGAWICQARVAPAHVALVGAALAKIHAAGEGVGGAPESRFGAAELAARLERLRAMTLPAEIAAAVELLGERLAELADRDLAGPRCVIHGDVFRDNVLWDGAALSAILDFESASLGDAPFDLMVTLLAWCYGDALEQPLALALVGAYRRERPLDAREVAACYDAARAAAVRFAVTRITDYELRPRGVVVYKDFRRFTARLAALEAIGRERFPAFLGLS